MDRNTQVYDAIFPGRVYAGEGSLGQAAQIAAEENAQHVVVLIDRAVVGLEAVEEMLRDLEGRFAGMIQDIPSEPANHDIQCVYERALEWHADLILAVGGGSVMDMAKVVSAAVRNPEFARAGFMDAGFILSPSIPTIMVPTTAGTGAEATPNAIFLIPDRELKVGVISPNFLASYVILEPRLTVGLPPALTASTGLDAFCHAVESYLSLKSNPLSRCLSLEAAQLIVQNLEKAYRNGADRKARENMQIGSFLAGLCLSSSTTVAVHALSYPLGGKYHIPHGIANAILLPWVLKANLPDCRTQYEKLAGLLLPEDEWKEDMAEAFVEWTFAFCARLQIPDKLTGYEIGKGDLDSLTDGAMETDRLLSQNPRRLTREEIRGIYERLL